VKVLRYLVGGTVAIGCLATAWWSRQAYRHIKDTFGEGEWPR
jgi:hypothetical protein